MAEEAITRDALRSELLSLKLELIEKLAPLNSLRQVEQELQSLRGAILSSEAVKEMIQTALREASARGWTTRERMMGVGLFLIALASLALNVWALSRGG